MAIGLSLCFGFHFRENFNYPYVSASIREFWRRWHISLSTWFKEYLYIPLGGNRKGTKRTWLNKLIVFFCTGLWHGANWTFVVWGLWHGFFIVAEDVVKRVFPAAQKPAKTRLGSCLKGGARHVYVLLVVLVGFVIFRADSLTQAAQMLAALFVGCKTLPQTGLLLAQCLTPTTWCALALGLLGSMPLLPKLKQALAARGEAAQNGWEAASYLAAVGLLVADILHLSAASYVPFIYFQF
jgi:alginate O-acetyltransferase complex protein AlgI